MKKKKINNRNQQHAHKGNKFQIMADFMPKPWDLAAMGKKVDVTIMLEDSNIKFFKRQAKKYGTSYKAMIRNLLEHYAAQAEKALR